MKRPTLITDLVLISNQEKNKSFSTLGLPSLTTKLHNSTRTSKTTWPPERASQLLPQAPSPQPPTTTTTAVVFSRGKAELTPMRDRQLPVPRRRRRTTLKLECFTSRTRFFRLLTRPSLLKIRSSVGHPAVSSPLSLALQTFNNHTTTTRPCS